MPAKFSLRTPSFAVAALLFAVAPALGAQPDDRAAVAIAKPQVLIVDHSLSAAAIATMLRPVDALYGFWNNGSQTLLDQAISPAFVDHTLLPGRPQGPKGPMAGAKAFMTAVPDLRCTVVQRIVAGDRVVSQLHFTGHFTGTFQGTKGRGQPISFIAFDVVTIHGGRITDISHLEDNLTFMKQVGLAR